MPTNFRDSSGTDFDARFALNQSGTYAANCGYRTSDGVDLSRRYEVIGFGSKGSDVNCRNSAGSDLSTLWAKIGTAIYALSCNGVTYTAGSSANTSEGGAQTAVVGFTIKSDGTWSISRTGKTTGGTPTSGTWLPSGQAASNYSVQLELAVSWTGTRNGTAANSAASYAALTADYTASVTSTAASASGQECYGSGSLVIRIRNNSTGNISTTTININTSASGYS
ncbi:hypothetical protein [Xanthomonas translucens]|uniref:hypothetical protein n=1 Tax=Xanthomonas campestris pv. translucens TaxID=343 RepID=UPI00071E7C6E|nr:hypothetical protein [Xanthomonas translucens]KTF40693.1 hypothetical protein OZ12_05575 [Xanthomonas translucens pv. translucens]